MGSGFQLPNRSEHFEMVSFIEASLESTSKLDVYGLHENAGLLRNFNDSQQLLDSISIVYGNIKHTPGNDFSTNDHLADLVQEMLRKLPPNFNIEACEEEYPLDYYQALNTVLVQEMRRFNVLLVQIRTTCEEVQKIHNGRLKFILSSEILMTIHFNRFNDANTGDERCLLLDGFRQNPESLAINLLSQPQAHWLIPSGLSPSTDVAARMVREWNARFLLDIRILFSAIIPGSCFTESCAKNRGANWQSDL